jgi:hypothetical protein
MLADSVGWDTINSNANILSASTVSLIANVSDNGVWWTDASAWIYMIPAVGGTYHPASSWSGEATRQAMTECLLPRESGTSTTQTSTNHFGGDGVFRRHVNDLLPRAGGNWGVGAFAGVFAVALSAASGFSDITVGARCLRLLSA